MKLFLAKKVGILLILIGLCIPIISLGFVSKYHPRRGLIGNLTKMELVIREDTPNSVYRILWKTYERVAIPYKYIFAFGTIFIFTGIGLIIVSKN